VQSQSKIAKPKGKPTPGGLTAGYPLHIVAQHPEHSQTQGRHHNKTERRQAQRDCQTTTEMLYKGQGRRMCFEKLGQTRGEHGYLSFNGVRHLTLHP